MGLNTWAPLVTDKYERGARLYPALLALLPMVIAVATSAVLSKSLASQLFALAGACGAAYFLANVSRMLGKAHEAKLFEKWGGTPSTQLLRHRSDLIDQHTKQRYHTFLARKIDTEFPTNEAEQASPSAADEVYRSGVKWLLGNTRDKTRFALLYNENVSYGFHRNGYGLRWLGALSGLSSVLWVAVSNHAYTPKTWLTMPSEQLAAVAIIIAITLASVAYFNESRVKHAAFAYADMLLRACDDLDQ